MVHARHLHGVERPRDHRRARDDATVVVVALRGSRRDRAVTVPLQLKQGVVVCRQRANQITHLLGLDRQDQTRMATAVSEIARNALTYAGPGSVTFALARVEGDTWFWTTVADEGPGITDLDRVLSGSYRSTTGMGSASSAASGSWTASRSSPLQRESPG